MLKIYINIKVPFGIKAPLGFNENWLKNTAEKVFGLLKKTGDYEFEINIIGSEEIKRINKKFRNKDKATTILSFVSSETKDKFIEAPSKYKYLGEIFLCIEEIEKQAKEIKISTRKQVTRILAHGILHLLEYGHDTDKRTREMEKKEKKILDALNIKC
ncbi:rRNA maturation RNase YbeY [bacterium]|nr:MAG: rRNA maturation RNase YbeY [bacterium]